MYVCASNVEAMFAYTYDKKESLLLSPHFYLFFYLFLFIYTLAS